MFGQADSRIRRMHSHKSHSFHMLYAVPRPLRWMLEGCNLELWLLTADLSLPSLTSVSCVLCSFTITFWIFTFSLFFRQVPSPSFNLSYLSSNKTVKFPDVQLRQVACLCWYTSKTALVLRILTYSRYVTVVISTRLNSGLWIHEECARMRGRKRWLRN